MVIHRPYPNTDSYSSTQSSPNRIWFIFVYYSYYNIYCSQNYHKLIGSFHSETRVPIRTPKWHRADKVLLWATNRKEGWCSPINRLPIPFRAWRNQEEIPIQIRIQLIHLDVYSLSLIGYWFQLLMSTAAIPYKYLEEFYKYLRVVAETWFELRFLLNLESLQLKSLTPFLSLLSLLFV